MGIPTSCSILFTGFRTVFATAKIAPLKTQKKTQTKCNKCTRLWIASLECEQVVFIYFDIFETRIERQKSLYRLSMFFYDKALDVIDKIVMWTKFIYEILNLEVLIISFGNRKDMKQLRYWWAAEAEEVIHWWPILDNRHICYDHFLKVKSE